MNPYPTDGAQSPSQWPKLLAETLVSVLSVVNR